MAWWAGRLRGFRTGEPSTSSSSKALSSPFSGVLGAPEGPGGVGVTEWRMGDDTDRLFGALRIEGTRGLPRVGVVVPSAMVPVAGRSPAYDSTLLLKPGDGASSLRPAVEARWERRRALSGVPR